MLELFRKPVCWFSHAKAQRSSDNPRTPCDVVITVIAFKIPATSSIKIHSFWLSEQTIVNKNRKKMDLYEPRREKTRSSGFPTTSDTNRAVQAQKMARGWKSRI